MKKLLTILGATGLVATTGITVVACGTDPKSWNGDDISKLETAWELDAYNQNKDGKYQPSIWLTPEQYKINEEGKLDLNLDAKSWSQIIWTGILNADDGENGTALKDFNDKKLWNVLHFTGDVNTIIKDNFKVNPSLSEEEIIVLEKDESHKLGMKTDVDIISKTDSSNPRDYGLKKSEMNFENGLKIHFIKAEK